MFRDQRKSVRGGIKKGIDNEDSRRKRADVTIELRKKNREEQLLKRRMNYNVQRKQENDENNQNNGNTNVDPINTKLTREGVDQMLKNMAPLVQGVNSNNPEEQFKATVNFRRMLSIENNPPIQAVIDSGVVPRLMQFLNCNSNEKLQFEAAWTITNIASGTTHHTQCVIKNGGIPLFVNLLQSPSHEVREQAVWALGNIAGDSPTYRDLVLGTGNCMQRILYILMNNNCKPRVSMTRNATWCLSNFCRGKPKPDFNAIKECIPVLGKLILNSDVEVLTDTCWSLSYVTDDQTDENKKIQAVVNQPGVCARLVYLLQHGAATVQVPALRTIGNIVTGDDKQTQAMLNENPLPVLLGTLSRQKKSLRKETCWTLSNITAGTPKQIQTVINANLIPVLVSILKESEFDVQKEAAWALSNITNGGTDDQVAHLVSQGTIPALCGMFKCGDVKIIMVVLEGLENILKIGKKRAVAQGEDNQFAELVEECEGLDELENLQRHENEDIYEKSVSLLQNYFESEEDDMGMGPEVDANSNQFSFGHLAQPGGATNFQF